MTNDVWALVEKYFWAEYDYQEALRIDVGVDEAAKKSIDAAQNLRDSLVNCAAGIRRTGLEIFNSPDARDAVEWFYNSMVVECQES